MLVFSCADIARDDTNTRVILPSMRAMVLGDTTVVRSRSGTFLAVRLEAGEANKPELDACRNKKRVAGCRECLVKISAELVLAEPVHKP